MIFRFPSDWFTSTVEFKTTVPIIPRSFTSSSSYAVVVVWNVAPSSGKKFLHIVALTENKISFLLVFNSSIAHRWRTGSRTRCPPLTFNNAKATWYHVTYLSTRYFLIFISAFATIQTFRLSSCTQLSRTKPVLTEMSLALRAASLNIWTGLII